MGLRVLTARVPWRLKLGAKLLLCRLPLTYRVWRRLGIFRDGAMDQAAYAWQTFSRCCLPILGAGGLKGATLLELGPGDSVATGLLAHAYGARRSILVDDNQHARDDIDLYRRMIREWIDTGLPLDHLLPCDSFASMCETAGISYYSGGLGTLRELPDGCIDFAFSNAVLEHIRRRQVQDILTEIRRVLKPEGASFHQIDLRDHLTGALNSLRFSERTWESDWFAGSGFYTNRLGYRDLLQMVAATGFDAEVTAIWRWPKLPTPPPQCNRSSAGRPISTYPVSTSSSGPAGGCRTTGCRPEESV